VGGGSGLFYMRANHAQKGIGKGGLVPAPLQQAGDEAIHFIAQDRTGQFWLGTDKSGLYSWRPGESPQHHAHDPADPYSLSDDDVRAINIDNAGRLWVGTFSGLNIFDHETKRFYRYAQEIGNPRSLSNGSVRAIEFDQRGSAWVGTYYGGVNYYNPDSYRFTHHQPQKGIGELSHPVVSAFWEDAKGNVWVGTEGGGLNYWDRNNDTYTQYWHTPEKADGLSGSNVKTVIGRGDSLWVGTFATGLHLYRPSTGEWQHWTQADGGLSNSNVYALLLDGKTLWIATYGGGINAMNLHTGEIRAYLPSQTNSTTIGTNVTRVLMKDLRGQIWVGTREGLLKVIHEPNGEVRFEHFLQESMICGLYPGRDSTLWVGTYQEGLFLLDANGNLIRQFEQADGLPSQSVFGILEDEDRDIWLSTEKGLARIDHHDKSITTYNYSDGLDNPEYNFNSAFQSRSGEMFFGGTQGFTSFMSAAIRTNTFLPPLVFTHLWFAGEPVRSGDDTGLLTVPLNETEGLTFSYNQANFTLGFAALDFLNPANNQYAYQLEGLDQDWKFVQGQAEVSYTLQRSGDYVFRLRGGNNDGLWNRQERRILITVLPPPWRTREAYLLYAGLLLLCVIAGYRFIQMRHRLQLEQLTTVQQEELHQAKLRFYTNVTHEFRTPLTLILGPIEDLMRKGVSAGGERQLQSIQQNAQRLLRLVNQLLNFRSLEHDHNRLRVAEGNFVPFVKEVYLSFQEQARIKDITYRFEASLQEILLWYDRDKMEKVLYNLLSNAFKFTPSGGNITVKLGETDNTVAVEVCDSGPGVPTELWSRIFERFVQEEVPAGNKTKGSGIGLALAKQLVEMHGGEIGLKEGLGPGACFHLYLPKGNTHFSEEDMLPDFKSSENMQAYVEKAQREPQATPSPFEQLTPKQSRQTLLVVEDNEEVRMYVEGIFAENFEVLLAENGNIGLKMAREHVPDLIISDIMMPGMDGIAMCSQLKSTVETSHIPIILLTARTGQIFRVEGLETGADAYLTKPFSPYELQLKVHNLLEARQRIRDRFHTTLKLEPKEITVTSADEAFLTRSMEIVEEYMEDPTFTVEVFAHELAVSRPLLFTKIKAITNQTPNNFVKSLRLKRSAQFLVQSDMGVAEIAYKVGFRDARYFSKCFQKEFGKTPSEYRNILTTQGKTKLD